VLDLISVFATCARERTGSAELPGILGHHAGRAVAAHSLRHASTASRECSKTLDACERRISDLDDLVVPSRVVHLPLSWDDPATQFGDSQIHAGRPPDAPLVPE